MAHQATAIFDLDGTLARVDTFLHFGFGFMRANPARWVRVTPFASAALRNAVRLASRDDVKCGFIAMSMAGAPRGALETYAAAFAGHLRMNLLRAKAWDVLEQHRASGDHLILATGSLDLYAAPIAAALGIPTVVATRSAWSADDRLLAMLDGPNLKGRAKRDAVASLIGEAALARATAYSDDLSDLPLLQAVGNGVLVTSDRRRAAIGAAAKLRCMSWD